MRNRFALLALLVVCLTVVGCASKQKKEEEPQMEPAVMQTEESEMTEKQSEATVAPSVVQYQKFRRNYDAALKPDLDDDLVFDNGSVPGGNTRATSVVLQRAHKALGTPYVFGGTKPGGFDCSGLVQWAYKGAGIKLPRTAAEQSRSGYRIRNKADMRAGDIVAFRRKRGGYHTGIYLGDGKFIHAPRTNTRVRIESMETGYFARNFIGARRVDTSEPNTALAKATREQDKQYEARSTKAKKSAGKVAARKSAKNSSRAQAKARSYTVKSGDTLSEVAEKNNTTVKSLLAANNLKNAHELRIGQKLVIPGKTAAAAKSGKSAKASRETKAAKGKKATVAKNQTKKASAAKTTAQAKSSRHIEVRPARKSADAARASKG